MKFEFESLAELKEFLAFMQEQLSPPPKDWRTMVMPTEVKERVKEAVKEAVEEPTQPEIVTEEKPKGVKKKSAAPKKAELAEAAMKAIREKVANHSDAITEALKKYDATRISQLKAIDLPDFIAEIEAL